MPYHTPRIAPYFSIASTVYREQLGVKRQTWPRNGDSVIWYTRIIATNILPMQYLDLAEEPPHRADTLFKTDPGRRGPRYHHDMGVVVYLRAVRSVKLPQEPLDAVADYGRANLSRYGKSKLATLTFPPDRVTHEQRPHALAACSKGRLEIPFAREALMPWKRQWARHNSSASSQLRGQTLPALGAAAFNDVLTRRCRHALQETVVPFPLNLRWLICPLHSTLP